MGDLWYPLSYPAEDKMEIVKGNYIHLYDIDGKKYIDAVSGLWNVSLGYSNERISEAVYEQSKKIHYVNPYEFSNEKSTELSKLIKSVNHDEIDKIFLTCTGSESNELAIKLSRKYQSLKRKFNRNKIGIFKESYHGSYYGSMSASNFEGRYRNGYGPLLSGFVEFSMTYKRCSTMREDTKEQAEIVKELVEQLEKELDENKDTLASIIVEPILGSAGVFEMPNEVIKLLYKFTKKNDILLIFDEVATGFGRTGEMFYYQHHNIKPDVVVMSKSINNGYLPLGAVGVSRKITGIFNMRRELLFHLSTQNCNPLCCTAGIETIKQLKENDYKLIHEVKEKGKYTLSELRKRLKNNPIIYDIRGKGLMIAIDLCNEYDNSLLDKRRLEFIVSNLKYNGLICDYNYTENLTSCFTLFLPFIISKEDINIVIDIIHNTISNC